MAGRCNFAAFQCPHLKAIGTAEVLPQEQPLSESALWLLVQPKVVKQPNTDSMRALYNTAVNAGVTPVAYWYPSDLGQFAFISVYAVNVSASGTVNRVVVRLDKSSSTFDCACCSRKITCIHKKLALWYCHSLYMSYILRIIIS